MCKALSFNHTKESIFDLIKKLEIYLDKSDTDS